MKPDKLKPESLNLDIFNFEICLSTSPMFCICQVDVTVLPEALSTCVRPDTRVPPTSSQSCTSYRADKQISYAFLYPPRESFLIEHT